MCMKNYWLTLSFIICLASCNSHSPHWEAISQVESYIEERPDSALVVLEQIVPSELSSKEEKAKHALLYSMALDKNFVDKTDFEILQPAIDYYEENGSATDRLRTNFYQGRIFQNQANNALAMECFVNALSEGGNSEDLKTKARVHYAQAMIYYSLYDWDNFIENIQYAAALFQEAGLHHQHIDCLILVVNGYTLKDDAENALFYINECKRLTSKMSLNSLCSYYTSYLTYLIKHGTKQDIEVIIKDYKVIIPATHIDWLTLSNAYIKIGEYNDALQSILQYDNSLSNQRIKYQALLSEIYECLGRYEESLNAYKEYMVVSDSTTWAIMQQDTKFVEERHNLELQTLKEKESKMRVLLCSALFIAILLAIIVFIRYRLKVNRMEKAIAEQETEKYRLLYLQMEEERDNLTNLLTQSEELSPEIKTAVVKRLELLNKFFTAFITNNSDIDRTASREMEELLANKDTFMVSTKLAFAGSHPKFIKYLEEHNLSEQEIEICCLYAIGLKGKDIKAYTNQSRHYHQSADIRHKLGLTESDTNLSIFLRDMLEK